jgi:hypothetical protein
MQQDLLQYEDTEFHNVAEVEEIIGEIATCIILFPESPGSYAELGFFSKNETLRKKLLVVNNAELQSQDSFLSLGPINLIDTHSTFKPTIQINYDDDNQFSLINQRLRSRIPTQKRRRFTYAPHGRLTYQNAFFSLFEIVRIFQCLTLEAVVYAYRSIFRNVNTTNVKRLLSVLVAAQYVHRRGILSDHFCANRAIKPFLELEELNSTATHLEVLDFYEKSFPDLAELAKDSSA